MPITKGYQQLVDEAMAQVTTYSVDQVRARAGDAKVQIVDIRDWREVEREGTLPGALLAPRGMLEFWVDPASQYYRDLFTPDKRFILYCAGGGRSALAAKAMKDMGYPDVAHMEAGFTGWAEAGMPIEDCKAGSKWVLRSDVS